MGGGDVVLINTECLYIHMFIVSSGLETVVLLTVSRMSMNVSDQEIKI